MFKQSFIRNGAFYRNSSAFFVVIALLSPMSASAAELIIADCEGTPRLVQEVAAETKQEVVLNIRDNQGRSVDGVEVILTGNTAQQPLSSVAESGTVTFREVTSGTWKYCITESSAKVTEVSLSSHNGGLDSKKVLGAGILGGSVAALGIVLGNDSSSGSSADSAAVDTKAEVAAPAVDSSSTSSTSPSSNNSAKGGSDSDKSSTLVNRRPVESVDDPCFSASTPQGKRVANVNDDCVAGPANALSPTL